MAAGGNGSISVNHSTKTITGSLTLDYVFKGEYSYSVIEGWSAGTVELTGEISGNSFSGIVTWVSPDTSDSIPVAIEGVSAGEFHGHFFGPDATELGGVITLIDFFQNMDDGLPEYNQMVVAFVGS